MSANGMLSPANEGQARVALLWWLGFILVAFNLRAPILVVGPLVDSLMLQLQLRPTLISILTTIPVICFALISPLAPGHAARVGLERAMSLALMLVMTGAILRANGDTLSLLLGTVFIGAGIACGNVYMPTFIKQYWPSKVGAVMGLYSVTIGLGATLATLTAIPVMNLTQTWRGPMLIWAVMGMISLVVWLLALRGLAPHQVNSAARLALRSVMKSRIAWALTLFMGCQSLSFYTIQAWLSQYLISRGLTDHDAAQVLTVINAVTIPVGFIVPQIATRLRQQSGMAILACSLIGAGMIGAILSPQQGVWLWGALIGMGQGASLSLAFVCMILRAREVHHSALLSSMSQSFGYGLAAFGPLLFGIFHDMTGGWTLAFALLFVALAVQMVAGVICGKAQWVEVR
ncbi:CynX/NimT family MFS transporter [Pokkaliibacter sp. CJK22405]|uniref:CynX/NimT family MFS transporter n=1 Tax=Pokkaliibacter sp. CJK22405 TaxID=3384615 RepID=UPI003984C118